MQQSTRAEWVLVVLWAGLLAVLLYSLTVGNQALGGLLTYVTLGLAILSVVVQYWQRRGE